MSEIQQISMLKIKERGKEIAPPVQMRGLMVLYGQLWVCESVKSYLCVCVCVSQRVVGFNLVMASKWGNHQKPSISTGIKHVSVTAIIHRVTGGGPGSDGQPGGNPFTDTCTDSTHTHTRSPSGWWPWASCCMNIRIIVRIFLRKNIQQRSLSALTEFCFDNQKMF